MPALLHIREFVPLGIYRSRHAEAIAQAVLAAGLRPPCALISAETDAQLDRSRPYWNRPGWWKDPAVLELHAAACTAEPGTVEHVYRDHAVPYLFVPGFEDPRTHELLRHSGADALLLLESPILRAPIFDVLPGGIINLHAAPLPAYRGNDATYWALYHDEPLLVSAHLVVPRIDFGPVLARCRLPVRRGDALADIDRRGFEACGRLAATVVAQARAEGAPICPQEPWQGRTFRAMPAEIRAELEARLASGGYSFYEP